MDRRDRRATLRAVFLLVQLGWLIAVFVGLDGALKATVFFSIAVNIVMFAVGEGFTVFGLFPKPNDETAKTCPRLQRNRPPMVHHRAA